MTKVVKVGLLNKRQQKRFEEIGYGEQVNSTVSNMTRLPTSAPEDVVARKLELLASRKLSKKKNKLQYILQVLAEFLLLPDPGRDVDSRNTNTDVAYSSGPCGTM